MATMDAIDVVVTSDQFVSFGRCPWRRKRGEVGGRGKGGQCKGLK